MLEYDKTGTSTDAAQELHGVIHRFQSHQNRDALPPNSLSIDPFPDRYSVNHRLLRMEQGDSGAVLRLEEKDPETIARIISEQSVLTAEAMRNIGLIVVGFFLHDLETPEERIAFLKALREQSPDAVLIVADYILKGASREEVLRLSNSTFERDRIQGMGEDEYVETHTRLSHVDIASTVGAAYTTSDTKMAPAGRALAVGVPLEHAVTKEMPPSQLLGTRNKVRGVLLRSPEEVGIQSEHVLTRI